MLRFNMILLLIVVVCALGAVTSQHRARKLFQAVEAEQERARQLDIEYGQLQLEMSTWANHPRIEKLPVSACTWWRRMRSVASCRRRSPSGQKKGGR